MKNSVSEQSFYIESEDEDEEEEFNKGEDDANDSDSSHNSNEDQPQSKPNSLNTTWPQSYRQSIDLYGSVPSPSITFLGTPTLSKLSGSSFLSSSLTRRHTPEILPSATKPLLPTVADEQQPQQRRSSHSLLPPIPSRKASAKKSAKVSHEVPASRQSSFGQATINGINVLCGVGILSTPYAVKEGGWAGLSLLFIFAALSYYTGLLLRYCLDSQPGLETYPDIGQAAFGTAGRFAVSIILYCELYASCVEYIILESDNLTSLFPNAHLSLGGYELNSHHLFGLLTALAVLPTVWLRDLSVLSYISVGGVIASILVVICLFWTGLVDKVGFQSKGTTLNLTTLPVAIGLYGYCYSGHAVFPNIYTSMEKRNQYPAVLLTSFAICTLMYAGVAVLGYRMFGESTESQFTLNMPQELVASKIAVWTTVVNPLTKYALTMTPVAMSLEELMPSNHLKSHIYAILIRTALVMSTMVVGLTVPFFGLVLSLIGSLFTMLVTLILPCACYLSILRGKVTLLQGSLCILVIAVGVVSSIFGTYSSFTKIVESLS
ncbi:amino acid transporter AVT1C-like [Diospyros lotus]|uniref:amino acid transporter AVT1C-like n=1 Tax=Diospyros lotus TaxID=55363 RepID=UPI0022575FC7|nr:amino acid transporter AVT1C-like [Diospyros lotus]XP_052199772.1 amino acid transporter AVT1C-like [Diospyros lotus]